jgi:hypothetical protein
MSRSRLGREWCIGESESLSLLLKSKECTDLQSRGRSSDDVNEEGLVMDLKENPRLHSQAPSGAPVGHYDPHPNGDSLAKADLSLSATTLLASRQRWSHAQDRRSTVVDIVTGPLKTVFYQKGLGELLTEEPFLNIMQMKLIGHLRSSVMAPNEVSNDMEAVKHLLHIMKKLGSCLERSMQTSCLT